MTTQADKLSPQTQR